MADEPQQPEDQNEEPQPEETPAEEPQPEETPAEEPKAEEAAEEAPAEEAPSDEAPPEEPPAEEAPAEEAPAEEAPAEQAEQPAAAEPEKPAETKGPAIPGAELDPIALEPDARLSTEERARLEAEAEERKLREAEATAESREEEPAATPRAQLDSGARFHATGKRKRSVARVTITAGGGKFEINERSVEDFFPRPTHQTMVRQPLAVTGYESGVDVRVRVHGGGVGGQAGAVRHGVARALTEIDPELRGDLKRRGFLTRDSRVKERRKAGLKKARKRPQFSKR